MAFYSFLHFPSLNPTIGQAVYHTLGARQHTKIHRLGLQHPHSDKGSLCGWPIT